MRTPEFPIQEEPDIKKDSDSEEDQLGSGQMTASARRFT